jgi:hypothetical protein
MKIRFTILFTFLGRSIFGQTLLSGIVKDEKGEAITGANVVDFFGYPFYYL